jgi:alpha-beta hydrolase superfamily lysophospholipase
MFSGIWDQPMVNQVAFHPRPERPKHLGETFGPIRDGTFNVGDGEKCCYRLFLPSEGHLLHAVVYHFHGNAEVCTNAGIKAEFFHHQGAALLSIDYRGYGWSTGTPSLTKLCADADACFAASQAVLDAAGCGSARRIMWGRSIGATCAVHIASTHAGKVHGLIVESGLMSVKRLPMVSALLPTLGQQLLGDKMGALAAGFGGGVLEMLPEPFATLDKMAAVSCPTLVMHGDKDEIVPIQQGIECYEKCASNQKVLKRWAQAGHNDIILHFDHEWSQEVTALLLRTLDFDNPFPAGAIVEAHSLNAAHMNGLRGPVLGPQGERVRVKFPDPHGEKALKPANLTVVEAPPEPQAPPPDPFPAGTLVETHSLKATQMNGLKGVVIGPQGDRLRIQLEEPHGEKALKPANLKVIDKQDGEEEGTST